MLLLPRLCTEMNLLEPRGDREPLQQDQEICQDSARFSNKVTRDKIFGMEMLLLERNHLIGSTSSFTDKQSNEFIIELE